jgi:RNA polymerase sigma factor (sigma-70 family)
MSLISNLRTVQLEIGDRNRLIESHYELASWLAKKAMQRLPRSISVEDLRQEGVLGLVEAATRFDPTLGPPFQAYGRRWVFGAIIKKFSGKRYRDTTHGELTESVLLKLAEQPRQIAAIEAHDNERVREIISFLPALQGAIIELRYWSDLPFSAIAVKLGITVSQVRKAHAAAIQRLHWEMRARGWGK